MEIPQQLLSEVIDEAQADEVGLWFIIGRIRDELGLEDPTLLKLTTLQFVNQILASNAIVAGYYNPDGSGVEVWDMEPEKVVCRIGEEWNKLGREPNIGEIVVFIGNQT